MTPCPIDMIFFSSEILNSFGLLLDIAGAILILLYSTSLKVSENGQEIIKEEFDPEKETMEEFKKRELRLIVKYNSRTKLGIGLLISGFSLQLLSNWSERILNFLLSL